MNPKVDIHIRRVTSEDHKALAQLLAENFHGKFVLALGTDTTLRQKLIELLIPTGIASPGYSYVISVKDVVVGTLTLKTIEVRLTTEDYRYARRILEPTLGTLRAFWAVNVLRYMAGPRLGPDDTYVDNLAITPSMQNLGIASQLVPFVEEECLNLGKTVLIGDVMSSNTPVIHLFRKAGWEVVSRNYWVAPISWPLFGTPGIFRIRKNLGNP